MNLFNLKILFPLKKFTLLTILLTIKSAFYTFGQTPTKTANDYIRPYTENFQYGANLGYYNAAWSDEVLAATAQGLGGHTLRPTLPEDFVERYGYSIRASTFNSYVGTYGMRELTCFVEGPSAAHRDMTRFPNTDGPSKLFANLYEPIWNSDGSVNANNYYAIYLFKLQQIYGDKVRFWEVVNEPDFTSNQADMDAWRTRAPQPGELVNLQAPIYHYIRMLRISYEVLKKYHPEAYITTGGVGYSQFVDALLRYTDNPNGGTVTAQYPQKAGAYLDALSFHSYPAYKLHYWDTSIGGFRYSRTSDYAAEMVMADRDSMAAALSRHGYGTTYPAKYLLMSETNIGRRTSDDRTGSDDMQRNFGIKTLVLAQKNNIRQVYLYQLGESVNAPVPGTSVSGEDELALMGLFENLKRDAPGAQKITQLGQAFATTSKLLYGWSYDAARTAALALPATLNGAAFSKDGAYTYVLWAKALYDTSEYASATYSFPAAWRLANLQRYDWNYAATATQTTVAAQGIALSGTPVFLRSSAASSLAVASISPASGVVGATVTLTGTNLAGATSVSFNGTATSTFGSNGATQLVLNVPGGATSGLVTVTTAAGTSNGLSFTVDPCPVATLAYGAANYCPTDPNPTPSLTGPTGGTFTAPAGLRLDAATGAIDVAASSPGAYAVTYSAPVGSCPVAATAQVTIAAPATATITAGGPTTFCQGDAVQLAAPAGAGNAYQFQLNGTAIGGATDTTYLARTSGAYTVTVRNAGGCVATSAPAVVVVNPLPATPTVTAQYMGAITRLTSSAASGNQFYVNGVAIPGATAPVYEVATPAQLGAYSVVVTDATGCSSAASPTFTITASVQPLPGSSLSIAPNPTPDGHLRVELAGYPKTVELSVLNALGQVVATATVPAGTHVQPLNLTNLAAGIYVLRAKTEGGLDVRRIVKE